MSTAPLWVPIAVAGIGVAGTLTAGIAGGLLAQRWADRRDDKTWERERLREQMRWRREDEARTFEHRREVFEDFYQAVKALARKAYDHGYGFDDTPELPFNWNADAAAKLQRLGIYVDRPSCIAAERAYDAAFWWGHHTKYNEPDDPEFHEGQQKFDDLNSSCWCSCGRPYPSQRAIRRCRHRAIATRANLNRAMKLQRTNRKKPDAQCPAAVWGRDALSGISNLI